jgi:uncharacterized protein YcnI
MKRSHALLAGLAGGLAVVPAAAAHVTLSEKTAPADSYQYLDVRVPNERPSASTTRIAVDIPADIFSVSVEAKPGWRVTVVRQKLDPPVTKFGERVTERVVRVIWSGGRIRPEQFARFGLSLLFPPRKGATLAFPATQTYSSGDVAHWDGAASAEHPAPRVRLTAAAKM